MRIALLLALFIQSAFAMDFTATGEQSFQASTEKSTIVFGEYYTLHQMGEITVEEREGLYGDREAAYELKITNHFPYEMCFVSKLTKKRNAVENWVDGGKVFILPGETLNIGGYGAATPGKSWAATWLFHATRNLEYCAPDA